MQWFFEDDRTRPVFSAGEHIESKHFTGEAVRLPKRAVMLCLGRGMPLIRERFEAAVAMEELPGFITHTPAYTVSGVCFADGGRGAPQAGCTVETLHALGVEEVLVVGLCGAFGEEARVCDVLFPPRLLSEEGVSRHYAPDPRFVEPEQIWSPALVRKALDGFCVRESPTVTSDAVYRQTFYKEALWRELGCQGVDMEASAIVSVCNFFGMKSTVLLMASDKHPLTEDSPKWAWGNENFRERRDEFIVACAKLAMEQ